MGMTNRGALATPALLAMLAACTAQPVLEPPSGVVTYHDAERATVDLAARSGSQVAGRLEVHRFGPGVRVTGTVTGLPAAGEYGMQIATTGDCSSADASSAGPVFNPHRSAHGAPSMGEHMAGDMDNIAADAGGVARVDQQLPGLTLGGGGYNDIAGRAIVVRARASDFVTQPDGAGGARIACGVVTVVLPPPEVR